eukprot:TRINITY_DN14137_c1_g1_i1.p1 TRINITY_DN14137_c1_g1~~TRINITY_DN14137_c1_g1_i1.p1  ORF type:complete len:201 (+),score=38.34 TRINITY_DN14137_c1_g1_i1:329-931(+)
MPPPLKTPRALGTRPVGLRLSLPNATPPQTTSTSALEGLRLSLPNASSPIAEASSSSSLQSSAGASMAAVLASGAFRKSQDTEAGWPPAQSRNQAGMQLDSAVPMASSPLIQATAPSSCPSSSLSSFQPPSRYPHPSAHAMSAVASQPVWLSTATLPESSATPKADFPQGSVILPSSKEKHGSVLWNTQATDSSMSMDVG